MRVLVSDYSGHPFQIQLSRHLASRGHDVMHVHFSGFQTPKGELQSRPGDPYNFRSEAVSLERPFAKHTFLTRQRQEVAVGRRIGKLIEQFRPAVVMSSNAPLDAQYKILQATRNQGARFVFWLQDVYSIGIACILEKKFGWAGQQIGRYYRDLEKSLLRRSDAIVAISADFVDFLKDNQIETPVTVIENWAPLESLGPPTASAARNNEPFRFIYSGTLGYKHDPLLLLALATRGGAEVYVYSEGPVADKLRQQTVQLGLRNFHVAGWVSFTELGTVLGQADALVAIIEADAGAYSVPSKVLSYLCIGKPLLLSVPKANLAAQIVLRERAGLVSEPARSEEFLDNARLLMTNPRLCSELGSNGRLYAEKNFEITAIADKFEAILSEKSRLAIANRRASLLSRHSWQLFSRPVTGTSLGQTPTQNPSA